MKLSREEFFAKAKALSKKETAFWLIEDYKAIEEMSQSGIISLLFAEAEFARLTEELLEESKNNV